MKLGMIWAQGRNGVIGTKGQLPWHLPEDLAHFKRVTQGCPVIMGRKTWESLPPRFRPLPGRANIVVSSMAGDDLRQVTELGATVVPSLAAALAHCQAQHPSTTMAWVIGGAQIYQAAMALADTLVVTHIEQDFEGDAFAPPVDDKVWTLTESSRVTAHNGWGLVFATYARQTA